MPNINIILPLPVQFLNLVLCGYTFPLAWCSVWTHKATIRPRQQLPTSDLFFYSLHRCPCMARGYNPLVLRSLGCSAPRRTRKAQTNLIFILLLGYISVCPDKILHILAIIKARRVWIVINFPEWTANLRAELHEKCTNAQSCRHCTWVLMIREKDTTRKRKNLIEIFVDCWEDLVCRALISMRIVKMLHRSIVRVCRKQYVLISLSFD